MFREPQLPEQGKQVVITGETMVIIPFDPVTIDNIRGQTAAKVRHLFNQLDVMLTGKSVCCNQPGQTSADDTYPHGSDP
jgi:hypothetical protein